MRFVLDTSVTIAWCFEDERHGSAIPVLDGLATGDEALAPAVWPLEVMNALDVGDRKGRSIRGSLAQVLEIIESLPIEVRTHQLSDAFTILELARGYRLTAYDAAYLQLAIQERIPLATLDGPLRRAATAAGVPILPAIAA